MKNIRAGAKLVGFLFGAFAVIPVQWVGLKLNLGYSKKLPVRFHRYLCGLIGINVIVRGNPYQDGPCLIASNHNSYLDIPVMGSVAPVSFVAKKEVGAWPFFGTLARLQETVFVDRERRTKAIHTANEIHQRIAGGDTLVLFPEGTSSDGNRVLPFKSALMGVAQMALGQGDDAKPVTVQPVSVTYTHLCGIPMGRQFRPFFAWYGDMDLAPHLWEAFSLGPFDVVVEYHEPITLEAGGSRKELARYCEARAAEGVLRALSGHGPANDDQSADGGTPEDASNSGENSPLSTKMPQKAALPVE